VSTKHRETDAGIVFGTDALQGSAHHLVLISPCRLSADRPDKMPVRTAWHLIWDQLAASAPCDIVSADAISAEEGEGIGKVWI
jgi:hypothetical protein